MRSLLPILSLLALSACDGPNGPNGPLVLGIVSGNHQTAKAGTDQLAKPVVGKMVRTKSGSVAFHLVTPAYAQDGTTVTGSPVAGAVVCAVSVTDGGLTPFTPCTNTASDGTATFFFSPGTKAGEARSEIRGTVEGQPAVFDTVVAEIEPGAPGTLAVAHGSSGGQFGSGTMPYHFPDGLVMDAYGNPVAYSLDVDSPLGISGDDSRTLQVVNDSAWQAGQESPRLWVPIRVTAEGSVVATGNVSGEGGAAFRIEWDTVALPSHAPPQ